jgi:glucan 1,3-beta-glucosidase
VESPLWSYQLGLQNGWIPTDPRTAKGKCKALNAPQVPFAGTYSAWQTGGPGAGSVAGSASYPWPPLTISGIAEDQYDYLPTYTPTSSISTLPSTQFTPSVLVGNGWFNTKDTASAMITVSGCSYPNAWDSAGVVAPTAVCPAAATPLASSTVIVATTMAVATTVLVTTTATVVSAATTDV